LLAELDAELGLAELSLWNMSPQWGLVCAVPLRRRDLLLLNGAMQILHAPERAPLLNLDPAASLEDQLQSVEHSRFAMHLTDADHGVLYTRDAHVAALAVRLLLGGIFSDMAGSEPLPSLDDASAASLLHTVPPGRWEEVHLEQLRYGWKATFSGDNMPTRQWIGASGSSWHTDWMW